jgi:hypothetical protein
MDCVSLEDCVKFSIKKSHLWQYFQKFKLTRNMRATEDQVAFKAQLMEIGNGTSPCLPLTDLIKLPENWVTEECLIREIFGSGPVISLNDLRERPNRAILCPTNEDTFKINSEIINRLEGEATEYHSTDSV